MLTGLARWLSYSGICAVTGSLAGSFTGLIFGLTLLPAPANGVPSGFALAVGAGLGILAWGVVMFLLVMMGRYRFDEVFFPSLFTCIVVSILTALIVNALHSPFAGMLIGWVLGYLVGRAFCALCTVRLQV
jgi:hypothetical protein